MFADGLEEFDSSRYISAHSLDFSFLTSIYREVVQNLINEYEACENADYVKWGTNAEAGQKSVPVRA